MEIKEPDPWQTSSSSASEVVNDTFGAKEFEDNFIASSKSDRLPDSAEYLASLEKKLARIKRGKGNKQTEGKELLKSLEETTDSCMHRLIAGDLSSLSEEDLLLELPLQNKTKIKFLIKGYNIGESTTVGEIVELIKADQLAEQSEETEKSD